MNKLVNSNSSSGGLDYGTPISHIYLYKHEIKDAIVRKVTPEICRKLETTSKELTSLLAHMNSMQSQSISGGLEKMSKKKLIYLLNNMNAQKKQALINAQAMCEEILKNNAALYMDTL